MEERLDAELRLVQAHNEKIVREKDYLFPHCQALQQEKRCLATKEQELDSLLGQLQKEKQTLLQQTQQVTRQRQRQQAIMETHKSQQQALTQTLDTVHKQAFAVVRQIHTLEGEIANVQYEVSKVEEETQKKEAKIQETQATLTKLEGWLEKEEAVLKEEEQALQRAQGEMETNARRVDRLNKKHREILDEALANAPKPKGPLEATISHLKKETMAFTEQINLQEAQHWRDKKTCEVSEAEGALLAEETGGLHANVVILQTKHKRLTEEIQQRKRKLQSVVASTEAIRVAIAQLNEDMDKTTRVLHGLGQAHTRLATTLDEDVLVLANANAAIADRVRTVRFLTPKIHVQLASLEEETQRWEGKIEEVMRTTRVVMGAK